MGTDANATFLGHTSTAVREATTASAGQAAVGTPRRWTRLLRNRFDIVSRLRLAASGDVQSETAITQMVRGCRESVGWVSVDPLRAADTLS
jgi:hypothetical protein